MKIISIDKNSSIPVYHQIREQIKEQINKGLLKPKDLLPSERILSKELEISRMTVKQAMDSLMNEGLIHKKKGVGTFVANPKIAQPLTKLTSFTKDMLQRGMKPGSKTISMTVVEATDEIRKILNIDENDKVIFMKRLRLADGEPMAVETSYLNYNLCYQLLDENPDNQSLYKVLIDKCNVRFSSAKQTIEVSDCSSKDRKLLNIPDDIPVFFIKRITYDNKNIPVEYVESAYRSDRYKFEVELKYSH